jgi:hypothetical protein
VNLELESRPVQAPMAVAPRERQLRRAALLKAISSTLAPASLSSSVRLLPRPQRVTLASEPKALARPECELQEWPLVGPRDSPSALPLQGQPKPKFADLPGRWRRVARRLNCSSLRCDPVRKPGNEQAQAIGR